jgi:hypothetical protein
MITSVRGYGMKSQNAACGNLKVKNNFNIQSKKSIFEFTKKRGHAMENFLHYPWFMG